jgi:hypothetical protein
MAWASGVLAAAGMTSYIISSRRIVVDEAEEIGKGAFGVVHGATLDGNRVVAKVRNTRVQVLADAQPTGKLL